MRPIAIIGRGCVLPGAFDVAAFGRNVLGGVDSVGPAPEGRWGIPHAQVMGTPTNWHDRTWSDAGGYVTGFAPPLGDYDIPAIEALDPLVHWLLHTGRMALQEGGVGLRDPRLGTTGAIFGNLSFPSEGMARWGERVLRDRLGLPPGPNADPRNHFMSGLPAELLARGLGLGRTCFAVDAACASSLYAIRLACDALNAGRADYMLAGAVNRADNLFLHVGFTALGAMSKTGQSRPFHRAADGLVPAEGAALVLLRRVDDALRDGDRILGVIRGVGLSNDGRGRNLLAPAAEGQVRAMKQAYRAAGADPAEVSLLECHATGTPTGDRTEVESISAVFPRGTPLGSYKSNVGHLITVAGAAGLLKVLAGMEAVTRPPTLHVEDPLDEVGAAGFRLVARGEPWDVESRVAGVSAFGFGGNNAHLVVSHGVSTQTIHVSMAPALRPVIASVASRIAPDGAHLPLEGLRFPPLDLRASLAQQTLLLEVAGEAIARAGVTGPRERTAVIVGMACDPVVTGWGLRWRLPPEDTRNRDAAAPSLRAEHVVGSMPNIPANRVSVQHDFAGPGFTVSAEELSGAAAIQIATDWLAEGDVDTVVVAAVDIGRDPRTDAARAALGGGPGSDSAVALVLRRDGPGVGTVGDVAWTTAGTGEPGSGAADALVRITRALAQAGDHTVRTRSIGGATVSIQVSASAAVSPAPDPVRGPVLDLELHPSLPVKRTQIMAPAPVLPRIAFDSPAQPPSPVVQPAVATPRPTAVMPSSPVPVAPHPTVPAATPPLLEALLANQRRGADSHARFLELQGQMELAFLAERTATAAALVGIAGGSVTSIGPLTRPSGAPSPEGRGGEATPHLAQAPTPEPSAVPSLPGPRLSRQDLERGASGSIASIFGPEFAEIDAYTRLVRMPEPPLLLADRVLGIAGPPRVLGRGTIWTETDIRADAWYLHDGRMPGGVLIESGQADLLLASWQGIDFHNRDEHVYRLLGCELTYHRGLPAVGETLSYDIHIDGHAKLGDIRMFFFHYDCKVGEARQISIREGQAGFFSDRDLAGSGGVLWDAATAEVDLALPHTLPAFRPDRVELTRPDLQALADGHPEQCFGPSHARAQTHTWSPRIAGGRMIFLDRVTIDLEGGPWKRGYLRAEQDITPDLWFFDGHFKNDPCMPGTLMFEGCLQAMQVYLTALGFTLPRDGWRFEPAKDLPFKLRCRGQVIPSSRLLVYELFVQAVMDGPHPRLVAQVLCTVDGLKCFHADPIVLELVPDWPLSRMPATPVTRPGVPFDFPALLACAWGRPSDAFGELYRRYDAGERCPRLPGPPYHFVTRVTRTSGQMGGMEQGSVAVIDYDIPPDAWYFPETGGTMPFAVVLEAALQPCGWLASWSGCALAYEGEMLFRNLDGTATWHREILPDAGTLTTTTTMTRVSRSGGMIILDFLVVVMQGGTPVFDMKTVFGFFPPAAFANQAGVGSTPAEQAWLGDTSDTRIDLRSRPARYFAGPAHLPAGNMLMLDRVTGYWPAAGKAGLGRWRAEKDVRVEEWMFKAHFYQDPVQPGSLGVEALIQLLQVHCIHTQAPGTRFEPLAIGNATTWKYRGQVTPDARLVQLELEITSESPGLTTADGHLWVDGKRIYSVKNMGMRVVAPSATPARRESVFHVPVPHDHAPTWVLPALPMMSMAMLALQATGATSLRDGVASRWFTFPAGPREVRARVEGATVSLLAAERGISPASPFFRATVGPAEIPELPVLLDAQPGEAGAALYESGHLFHGPAFHVVEQVVARGSNGVTLLLRPAAPDILLDGATHGVPHDGLEAWFPAVAPGQVGYPSRLRSLAVYGAPPTGPVRCEVRALPEENGRPRIGAWFYEADRLCAAFDLDEVLLPKGRIGSAAPTSRRAFLQGRYIEGVSLSHLEGDTATLSAAEVTGTDWLPGTVLRVFGTESAAGIAARELEGARLHVHPRDIETEPVSDGFHTWDRHHPLVTRRVSVSTKGTRATVTGGTIDPLDTAPVVRWWRRFLECGEWSGERALIHAIRTGLASLTLHDPDGLAAVRGRPCLYLANHETYVESVIFCCVLSALQEVPVNALAKAEHQEGWLGRFHAGLQASKEARFPGFMVYFDQARPQDLGPLVREECRSRSLLVHVEGTRQISSGEPVTKMSSLWVDLALEREIPIVPVAFRGGVAGEKADLPIGPQDIHVGSPLLPAELAAIPYADRRKRVMDAINSFPARKAVSRCDWTGWPPES